MPPLPALVAPLLAGAALVAAAVPPSPAGAQPAAAPPPGQGAGQAQREPFRIVNRTGQEVTALHAVRSGRGEWGRNLLERPLAPDRVFLIRPGERAGCRFDIRLVLADGREARLMDQDICANRTLVAEPAQVMAAAPPPPAPPPGASAAPAPGPVRINPNARASSGTGFVVARDRVLTNQHVIADCNRVLVRTADNRLLAAVPPAQVDRQRDLALLAVPGDPGPPLAFRAAPPVRRGEGVVTYGFPLSGLLSSGPTLTTGEVSALAGLRDNPQQFQISAPVQPGNSGGPLLDRLGHVVGVVVSKLNAQRVAQFTGDIPQNVNFAVKGTEALDFLRRAGVTPRLAESRGPERSAAEVGEAAHPSTVFLRCER
ncbi:trypsin-like peptidase domain-containing protein [Caldovatus sp. SYSU G05006]|uniref:Serine protease n=2 Tax=Caldovatus aquaticus TaxID=2865671 RepID=A0ABS7F3D9_9PROT|nr:trypsin-like peptidase domain-containing protein [Caldovatus aquaticus]